MLPQVKGVELASIALKKRELAVRLVFFKNLVRSVCRVRVASEDKIHVDRAEMGDRRFDQLDLVLDAQAGGNPRGLTCRTNSTGRWCCCVDRRFVNTGENRNFRIEVRYHCRNGGGMLGSGGLERRPRQRIGRPGRHRASSRNWHLR